MIKCQSRIFVAVITVIIFPGLVSAGQFEVTYVYDDCSFRASWGHYEIKVRLAGIEIPEVSKQKIESGPSIHEQAKKRLIGLILNRRVEITEYGYAPDHRILGEVLAPRHAVLLEVPYSDTVNVNLILVEEGLAAVYRGRMPSELDAGPYWEAESRARQLGRGMWRR